MLSGAIERARRRKNSTSSRSRNRLIGAGAGGPLPARWHWWSEEGQRIEQQMLEKVEEIENSDAWKKNPVYGRWLITRFIKLNLSVFHPDGGRMLAHLRPSVSRIDDFVGMVCSGMMVWYGFAITLSVEQTYMPVPPGLQGGWLVVWRAGTFLWQILPCWCLGGLGSTCVQGVAVMATPATQLEDFINRHSYGFSSLFAGGFMSFYLMVLAFTLRTLAFFCPPPIESEIWRSGAWDEWVPIITAIALSIGFGWGLTCAFLATDSVTSARRPWMQAYRALAAEREDPRAGTSKRAEGGKPPPVAPPKDGSPWGSSTSDLKGNLLKELERIKALHDSGYLTDAERDVMVEGAKKAAKGVFSSSVEEVPAQGQTLQEI